MKRKNDGQAYRVEENVDDADFVGFPPNGNNADISTKGEYGACGYLRRGRRRQFQTRANCKTVITEFQTTGQK